MYTLRRVPSVETTTMTMHVDLQVPDNSSGGKRNNPPLDIPDIQTLLFPKKYIYYC